MWSQIPSLMFSSWLLMEITRASQVRIAKPGCKDHGGNITIPSPFGIGPKCYHNHWFDSCQREVSPIQQEIKKRTLVISTASTGLCGTTNGGSSELLKPALSSYDLRGSPFLYSKKHNVLLVGGCGGSVTVVDTKLQTVAGCAAVCINGSEVTKSCYGLGCCQTTIPFSLDHYGFKAVNLRVVPNVSECLVVALVDSSSIINKAIDTQLSDFAPAPTVLEWRMENLPVQSPSYANSTCELRKSGADDEGGYVCRCRADFYQGNPYLPFGCQKRRDIRLKSKYFKRNGGLLLKQQMSSEDSSSFERIKIFTSHEREKAIDGCNENRILGKGGQGTVFKGILPDGKIVSIKRSKIVNERQLNVFINEMVILSQINHRNAVKLLGCCLETEVPLLVYEYVPNGTLAQHIHNPSEEFPFTWEMRLQIATDTANALAYMHSSSCIPIFQRYKIIQHPFGQQVQS
ncbi:hypothetical protein Cgig2_004240 [Carnegiea gigantea]|uniref:Protein kinase domain-containing protein n=1 Tax=Carnegiea gigantea TaxID=171969 RepID=A0A9Q1K3B7_9CARY|nr:hypothetical protein Cgig2_004240 [Carnegiea gigantea]